MSIFDVFSFKSAAKSVFTKENFVYILTLAKEEIIKRAKEEIDGCIKKAQVDSIIQNALDRLVADCNNKLVIFVVDQIKKAVPSVTQLVYDFLKARIEEL